MAPVYYELLTSIAQTYGSGEKLNSVPSVEESFLLVEHSCAFESERD